MIKKYLRKYKKTLCFFGAVFFLGASLLGVYVWYWEVRLPVLEVHVFTADTIIATFIRTPDNHTILVDGGKTDGIMRALTSMMPFYRRNIDSVILTKNDDAHVAGLVDVVSRYHVGKVIEMSTDFSSTTLAVSTTSTACLEFEKIIREKNIPVRHVAKGDHISFENGMHGEVSATVLFPARDFKFSKTNLPQLALRIEYGTTSFAIGDLSKTEQKYIASSSVYTNILISQHVGGTGTASDMFFSAVHPEYVVISKKPALVSTASRVPTTKKPKKPPFSIFNLAGLKIHNLAVDGNIEFISDGITVSKK